ncbi:hypothetical protein BRAS3843_1830029 [Bradyrhizobium sp. STM 3843]|nr:hypothetical protein BRAS3843_1830029 [Bradyrhizobium sp. STM 3843]
MNQHGALIVRNRSSDDPRNHHPQITRFNRDANFATLSAAVDCARVQRSWPVVEGRKRRFRA